MEEKKEESETKKEVNVKYIEFEINANENKAFFENGSTILNGVDLTDFVVGLKLTIVDTSDFPDEDIKKWDDIKSKIIDKLESKRVIYQDDSLDLSNIDYEGGDDSD